MPPGKHFSRREFLYAAGLLGLYTWILTSSVGCFFRRSEAPPPVEDTSPFPLPEVTPAPIRVEKSPVPSPEEVAPTPVLVENPPASPPRKEPATSSPDHLKEAKYYQRLERNNVQCQLCFRKCTIPEGGRGFCLARENINGKLYTLTYGKPVALHIDPVEKEPMFHMEPGSDTLCLGTACCSFRCKFCINWHIAWKAPEDVEAVTMTPEEVIKAAKEHDVPTICFTYNDPVQQYEFMFDTAMMAKDNGLKATFHSNGSILPEPLKALLPYMDSAAIDLKGFNPDVYRKLTEGELEPVLNTLKLIKEEGVWLEVVCLVVPTWNDNIDDIKNMCNWIRENLGEETPVHFSRFFPTCKLTGLSPTPVSTLEQAHDIAREAGLHHIYIGNVSGHETANTYCTNCGKILIERKGLLIQQNNITKGKCNFCGYEIPGIWSQ